MGRDLPEGLREMAKDSEGIDRRELEETYDELVEEVKSTNLERRTLLSAFAGGGGLATLNALFAQKKYMGESLEAGLKAIDENSDSITGVQKQEAAPYDVDDEIYERFDAREVDFNYTSDVFEWIKKKGGTPINIFGDNRDKYMIENGVTCAGSK